MLSEEAWAAVFARDGREVFAFETLCGSEHDARLSAELILADSEWSLARVVRVRVIETGGGP